MSECQIDVKVLTSICLSFLTCFLTPILTLCPRQQHNGGPPVANHRMPPVSGCGSPHGCPADSGGPLATVLEHRWAISGHQWQISLTDCRLRATGGPAVALLPLIATGGPLE